MTRTEELKLDISVIKKEIKKVSENCYYNEVTILELELEEKQKELEHESSKTH